MQQQPSSLCCCLLNHARHLSLLCTTASPTDFPLPPSLVGAGWACSFIRPCLLFFSAGLVGAQLAVKHRMSVRGSTRIG